MFPIAATAHNVSICLRCQYRLSVRQRTRQKPSRFPLGRLVSRLLTSRSSTTQHILHSRYLTLSNEKIIENPPKVRFDPRPEHFIKRQKAFLDINALGKPGEVLVLAETPTKRDEDSAFEKKEIVKGSAAIDASQIIDKMNGETGMVGSERVAEILENIRLSWTQNRSKTPTLSEFEELAKSLSDGFTRRQLLHYFQMQSSRHLDPQLELLGAWSTDLYTRSEWRPRSMPFPVDSLRRLDEIKAEIDAKKGSSQVLKRSRTSKPVIVNQILQQRWHLRTQEDLKSSGEVDIWISRAHLKVLLNHRRALLRGLSQQYGINIDVSTSYAVLRITADFDTCVEVFKSILYLLENIHMSEIKVPLDEFSVGQSAKREEMSIRSLLSQVEKVTSTGISLLSSVQKVKFTEEKLRICYLGPGDEDLEDVRRVLSQTLRRTTPKASFAFWAGGEKLQSVQPIPIETEKRLPLVKRGKQWARWSYGAKRKPDAAKKLDELQRANDSEQTEEKKPLESTDSDSIKSARAPELRRKILKSLLGEAKDSSSMKGSSTSCSSNLPIQKSSIQADRLADSFWATSPARKTSAVFGHILYPLNNSDTMKKAQKGSKHNSILQAFFNSRREILTSITSPRCYLQRRRLGDSKKSEELRIMLTPAQKADLEVPRRELPGLMLYVRIDPDTKEPSLSEVRLILEEREVDLLLPDEVTDIRFITESFLPAAREVDPTIVKFFKASYLDVTGHQRLRTPKNLTLLVPAHTIRTISAASGTSTTASSGPPPWEGTKPGVSVEYTFTSLEHRSVVTGFDIESGFRVRYSFIEGGETGGRRDELRMMFVEQLRKNPDGDRRLPLDSGDDSHRHEGKESVVNKKTFKRFYDAAISLV